ncbi:hypothetical protein GPX89_13935 [Nocardia sp. ET3-3]|uniref:ABC-2 type transport system permease protein n=1 Tax=Nocardia terrae TaxID=2675851 RepID=A0A7K1UVQ3_9NOCA|nr:hypothetical protein [Nocardia terrae]MVU78341.1 hypothetical protein [Nocardia terrae]
MTDRAWHGVTDPAWLGVTDRAGHGFAVMVRARLRANRISLAVMTVLMAVFCAASLQTYVVAFPAEATRAAMLAPLVNNGALRALYGYPFDIGDPAGWVAWRTMTSVGLIMAVWASIITAGALRGEEDAGRGDLVLSGAQPRRRWFAAAVTATVLQAGVIGAVCVSALAAIGIPQHLLTLANAGELGLQLVAPAWFFAAVAALTSQLTATVRGARLLAASVVVVAFVVRAPADIGDGIPWLRWVTPLGWFEELRPPAAPSLPALTVILAGTIVLLGVSMLMLGRRDIGRGLLEVRESRSPRRLLLGSPARAALREEAPQLVFWFAGTALYALLMGSLVKTMLDFLRRTPMYTQFFGSKLAVDSFVALLFSLIQLLAALLAVTVIVAARAEEATGRLDLVLAMPRSRSAWLSGRALLALGSAAALTAVAAVCIWSGAAFTGQSLAPGALVTAAANSLPLLAVVIGAAALALAVVPRAVSFVHALVVAAYLWDTLGTTLKLPEWALRPSPFHALARIPVQPFAPTPAATVAVVAAALFTAALIVFRRRDLAAA